MKADEHTTKLELLAQSFVAATDKLRLMRQELEELRLELQHQEGKVRNQEGEVRKISKEMDEVRSETLGSAGMTEAHRT